MNNPETKYISDEKALVEIQKLLDAGASKRLVAKCLAGLDSDRAWRMRKELLDAGVEKHDIVAGLAGLDSDRAWQMRKQSLKAIPEESLDNYFGIAASLAGLDSDRAWQWRNDIDRGLRDGNMDGYSCAKVIDTIHEGLAGLDSDRAWQWRNDFYRLGTEVGHIFVGLAGLDSDRAWQMRKDLIEDGSNKHVVVLGLAGLDSDRAWQMRRDLLDKGANKGSVADGLIGLDSDRAWQMRRDLLDKGANKGSVVIGLAGLDSDRAWQMRKELLDEDEKVDEGIKNIDIVAVSIVGNYERIIWRLMAKEREKDLTKFFITNQKEEKVNFYPHTYIVYDLETTGLDPMKDEAVEIGALLVKEGEEPIFKKWILKPSIPIPVEASNIHKITQDDVERFGRDPTECWREFAKFTGIDQPVPPYPFVGHNIVSYDNIITNRAIRDIGLSLTNVKSIDTAAICKGLKMGVLRREEESHEAYATRILGTRVPGLKYKLELIYGEFGGSVGGVNAHRAEGDVMMTNFVYRKLAGFS